MHLSTRLSRALIIFFAVCIALSMIVVAISFVASVGWLIYNTGVVHTEVGHGEVHATLVGGEATAGFSKASRGGFTVAELDKELGRPGEDVPFAALPSNLAKGWATGGKHGIYHKWVLENDDRAPSVLYVEFVKGRSGKPCLVTDFVHPERLQPAMVPTASASKAEPKN
jgi:hypothetical protein